MECYRHLASVYNLLYKKTTTPDNLDLSIGHYSQALGLLHPQSPNRAPMLFNLSKQHFERYTLTKDQADLIAAQKYRDEAQTLVDQAPKMEKLKKKIANLSCDMDLYTKCVVSYETLIGNVTGFQNPRVLPRVSLGYGYGLGIPYPRKTRTRAAGFGLPAP